MASVVQKEWLGSQHCDVSVFQAPGGAQIKHQKQLTHAIHAAVI